MGRINIRRTILGLGAVSLATVTVTASPAVAAKDEELESALGLLWETVLELPIPLNPFTSDDHCVELGDGVVAPFAQPPEPSRITCTVEAGTEVFVTAWSSECSTVEDPPYFGRNERKLRKCARKADKKYELLTIMVDGRSVPVSEVETDLLTVDLPANNIFGIVPQEALSVGHGWVASLRPLSPGRHEIVIHVVGTDVFGVDVDFFTRTGLIVEPGP